MRLYGLERRAERSAGGVGVGERVARTASGLPACLAASQPRMTSSTSGARLGTTRLYPGPRKSGQYYRLARLGTAARLPDAIKQWNSTTPRLGSAILRE
jgi:hypothetical protein